MILIPSGQTVTYVETNAQKDIYISYATLTAYDPERDQYLAIGHEMPDGRDVSWSPVWPGLTAWVKGENQLRFLHKITGPILGIVRNQNQYGIVIQALRQPTVQKMETGQAKPGRAVVKNTALTYKAAKGEIVRVDVDTFEMVLEEPDGVTCANGMSGSPVIQDGKLVGVLSKAYLDHRERIICTSIEKMAEALLSEGENQVSKLIQSFRPVKRRAGAKGEAAKRISQKRADHHRLHGQTAKAAEVDRLRKKYGKGDGT